MDTKISSASLLIFLLGCCSCLGLDLTIEEEMPSDTLIANLPAESGLHNTYKDEDLKLLRYSFLNQPNTHSEYFTVGQTTGQIRTAKRIDRDSICPYQDTCKLLVDVVIGPAQFFQVINIRITLTDRNDNTPTFPVATKYLSVSESVAIGTRYTLPIAADPDSGTNGLQAYELVGNGLPEWELKGTVGPGEVGDLQLVVKSALDRESRDRYLIQILAKDGGNPALTGTMFVNITIEDANDNSPVFQNSTYTVSVAENTTVNSSILQVHADDPDLGLNGQVVYGLAQRTADKYSGMFAIDRTGDVRLLKALDYEETAVYHLSVTAEDLGTGSQQARAVVVINVLDVNDCAPQIIVSTLPDVVIPQVAEGVSPGTFVAHVSALDQDTGTGGAVVCEMAGDAGFTLEYLQKAQYKIMTAAVFDRETRDTYTLTLTCRDFGIPSLSSSLNVTVRIADVNDHDPIFSQTTYYANIAENNELNSFVLRVTATDQDAGPNSQIQYKLAQDSGGYFHVDPVEGIIHTTVRLDYELMQEIQFHVVAFDGASEPRSSTAVVIVTILDMNDNAPVFSASQYEFRALENQASGMRVGVVEAQDLDDDPYNIIRFSLASHVPHKTFAIDSASGVIKTLRQLDREENSVHQLTIYAENPPISKDEVIMSSTVTVIIHVIDENDNAPLILYPTQLNHTINIYNDVPIGEVITHIRASDPDDGDNGIISFSVNEGNEDGAFDIEPLTGQVKVHRNLRKVEFNVYSLKIIVSDSGNPPRMSWTTLTIFVNESSSASILGLSGTNKTIVISLTVSFVFIIVVLIASICIVRSYDRRMGRSPNSSTTKTPTNSIKIEVQKMFHMVHESPGGHSTTNSSVDSGSPAQRDSSGSSQSKGPDVTKCGPPVSDPAGRPKQAIQMPFESSHQTAILPLVNQTKKSPETSINNITTPATDKEIRPSQAVYRDPRSNSLYDSNCMYRAQQTPHPTHNHRLNHRQVHPTMPVTSLTADPQRVSHMALTHRSHLYHQLPQQHRQHPPSRQSENPFEVSQKELEIQRILRLMEKGDGDTESTLSGDGSNTSNTDSGKGPSEEGEATSISQQLDSSTETVLLKKLRELGGLDFTSEPSRPTSRGQVIARCNSACAPNNKPQKLTHNDTSRMISSDNQLHNRTSSSNLPFYTKTVAQLKPTDCRFIRQPEVKHGGYVSRDQLGRSSMESMGHSSNGDIADDATTTSGSYVVDLDDVNSVDFNQDLQIKDSQV